jgi:hypothetical protein
MNMRANVVPAIIPPVTNDIAMSESPSPTSEESAMAGRVFSIFMPVIPLLIMAKMMLVNRKKRASSVMMAHTVIPDVVAVCVELPITDVVVSDVELTWLTGTACAGDDADETDVGSGTGAAVACTGAACVGATGRAGKDPEVAVEPVRAV